MRYFFSLIFLLALMASTLQGQTLVAIDDLRKNAERGDAEAQFRFGYAYMNGEGVKQDYEEALKWYRRAAAQGHTGAQNNLGFMYMRGYGVTQDFDKAIKWFSKAAELGDKQAQNNLTMLRVNGYVAKETPADEEIVQINNDVITLSLLKSEMKVAAHLLAKQRGITEQQAMKEINAQQAVVIARLVNEQLLFERGRKLRLTDEAEQQVNQQLLKVANEEGFETIEAFDNSLRASNLDPKIVRRVLRARIVSDLVFELEVDAKVSVNPAPDELKRYYETHSDKFRPADAPSGKPVFNEKQVREAMLEERVNRERAKYLSDLRRNAYIGITENYKDEVMPLLPESTLIVSLKKETYRSKSRLQEYSEVFIKCAVLGILSRGMYVCPELERANEKKKKKKKK